MTARRVLVAFDKFKGALDAEQACRVAADVIGHERPGWTVDVAPLTDGGEGFCQIMTRAVGGTLHDARASGPLFDAAALPRVLAHVGLVELGVLPEAASALLALPAEARRLAVIDMASVNGLALVPPGRRDVYRSSTLGTGELLLAARDLGCDAILLGVGGSATSDLGLGALSALGWRFESRAGALLAPPVPASWPQLARVVRGEASALPPLRIACDVDNPLLGPRGAAAIYGPQKGLAADAAAGFDAVAEQVAALLCAAAGVDSELSLAPGAGAAGGIAFGLLAAAGARLVPGSALVDAWLGLDARVATADWVLTGEGRFDASSWAGKGPGALVRAAQRRGRGWAVFAGSIALGARERRGAAARGGRLVAITPRGEPIASALPRTAENLARSVRAWLAGLEARARR